MKKEKNILIIGGAGYIGSHVVLEFCNQGENVYVFDDLSLGKKINIDKRAELIKGSILNKSDLDKVFLKVKPRTVIHLAALKAAGDSMNKPQIYSETNIVGSLNILSAMLKYNIKDIIFSSSAAVYGEPQYLPMDEKHDTNPINYYGFTKKSIEDYIIWYSKLKGINYAILRYFNASGFDSNKRIKGLENNPQNLLPIIMEVLIGKRKKMNVFGNDYNTKDGTCERDYIHVTDLANAHYLSYKKLIKDNENIILNLATGHKYSVLDIILGCKKYLNTDLNYEFVDRREGDPEVLYAKSSYAYNLLGWKPKYSNLKYLLETTYNIYKDYK